MFKTQLSLSKRQKVVLCAAVGILAVTAGAWGIHQNRANAAAQAQGAQAAPVDVAEVLQRSIIDWQNYSGRLEAVDRVEIRPQVSGILTAVHFKDGSLVKKGDQLFSIDARPFAAEVARAQAQLAAAESRTVYTAADLARGERLMAENAIAKRDFEEKQNAAREAVASRQAAHAALRVAQLNLEYTKITAPIDGRVSRAEITVGNLVAANSSVLTSVVSSKRIYASFDVDEQAFLRYVNPARNQAAQKTPSLPIYLGLANDEGYPRQGTISSVDNRLDPSSGTIRVRAVFENSDGQLVPGLYARIRLGSGSPRDALLIDEKAIGTDQDKRFVFVLGADNKTAYREIRLGALQEGLRIVESGLQSGERIVVNGLQRVRPGDVVAPQVVAMTGEKQQPQASNAAEAVPANEAAKPASAAAASAPATAPAAAPEVPKAKAQKAQTAPTAQ